MNHRTKLILNLAARKKSKSNNTKTKPESSSESEDDANNNFSQENEESFNLENNDNTSSNKILDEESLKNKRAFLSGFMEVDPSSLKEMENTSLTTSLNSETSAAVNEINMEFGVSSNNDSFNLSNIINGSFLQNNTTEVCEEAAKILYEFDVTENDVLYDPGFIVGNDDLPYENEQNVCVEQTDIICEGEPEIRKKKIYPLKDPNIRKRIRNEDNWKCNVARKKRNMGEEYESYTTKKTIKARVMGPTCEAKNNGKSCRLKCHEKIKLEEKEGIFQKFWSLGSHEKHMDFISKHVIKETKKVCTVSKAKISRRNFSFKYILTANGNLIPVCKVYFLNTLGVNDMWIRSTMEKLDRSQIGIGSPDQRGRLIITNKKLSGILKNMKEHINLFPRVESHYVRENTARQYLQEDINSIAQMYRLYREWIKDKNLPEGTYRQYRHVFNNYFNIGFFVPKKDQCDECDRFKIADEEEKEILSLRIDEHTRNKEAVRRLKETDKLNTSKDSTLTVACFDLQKVLSTPYKEVSIFYYKLKYSTYNFTVFDLGKSKAHCYVWHEILAKRGANEIGSCLLNYIKMKSMSGTKNFIFYSDNCSGQNRNRFVFAMYVYAAKKYKVSIIHRFLEKGHTQNEGDSVHALIERQKKNKIIFTPEQWIMLIRNAKTTGEPYEVIEVSQDDIYNLKSLVSSNENWITSQEGSNVKWTDIREISVECDNPSILKIKYDFTDPDKSCTVNLEKKKSSKKNLPVLQQAYNTRLPISKKKYDHLQFLCKRSVPKVYHDFFKTLPFTKAVREDDEDED